MYCKNCGGELSNNQEVCLKCGFKVGKGEKYCFNCGKEINPGAEICLNCGFKINGKHSTFSNESKSEAYEKLANYEKTSSIIWLVIGILQILTIVGIIVGAWNVYQSWKRKKNAETIKTVQPSGLYKVYEDRMTTLIVFAVLNFFLGAILGLVGVGYDFYVRNYVLSNKDIFE